MTVEECERRIEDLKEVVALYYKFFNDPKSSLYKCRSLSHLTKKAKDEMIMLGELLYNDELENSYDQNTGELYEH